MLRLAIPEDSPLVFEWRNHQFNRAWAKNFDEVTQSEHDWFFDKCLHHDGCHLLVDPELGVFRCDQRANMGIVSVFLKPNMIGRGHGAELIKQGSQFMFDNYEPCLLIAEILPSNIRSQKAFLRAGYQQVLNDIFVLRAPSRPAC